MACFVLLILNLRAISMGFSENSILNMTIVSFIPGYVYNIHDDRRSKRKHYTAPINNNNFDRTISEQKNAAKLRRVLVKFLLLRSPFELHIV